MQFVAFPSDLLTLRILLCAGRASRVEFTEHLLKCLAALTLQGARLGCWANLALLGASEFFFGLTGAASAWSFFSRDSRASLAVESRLICPMSCSSKVIFDHARMHELDQLTGCKLFNGATEGGFAGQFKT